MRPRTEFPLVTTRAPIFFARSQSAALLMLASGAIVATSVPFRLRMLSMDMASPHFGEPRFERAVEAQTCVRSLAWNGLEPVTLSAGRSPSDALENLCASHPYYAAIRRDLRRDPSCGNGRRADKAPGPVRGHPAEIGG